jgi:hypothetical protein
MARVFPPSRAARNGNLDSPRNSRNRGVFFLLLNADENDRQTLCDRWLYEDPGWRAPSNRRGAPQVKRDILETKVLAGSADKYLKVVGSSSHAAPPAEGSNRVSTSCSLQIQPQELELET